MCRVSGVRLSMSSRARPSMSGRPMSSMMASGENRRASEATAPPSPVTTPLNPTSRTRASRMSAKRLSSSTISTTESLLSIASRSSATGSGAGAASAMLVEATKRGIGVALEPLAAFHPQLAAEQTRDLAADRQAQARTAVLAAGGAVGLLEGLEDDPLLVLGDADAAVLDLEGQHLAGAVEVVVAAAPAVGDALDLQLHMALLGELEVVGEKVLDDLLQALVVGVHRPRQVRAEL